MPVSKMYLGTALEDEQSIDQKDDAMKPAPYIPGPDLVRAVQLAQILQRPLLVKGEPGCGKSRLAEAVAYELFGENYKQFYFEWHVKSNSKAQDGLYVVNYLQRLSDANFHKGAGKEENDSENNPRNIDITLAKETDGTYKNKGDYLELGELGKAFQLTQHMKVVEIQSPPEEIQSPPPVVLIDEIDKADIDFPNDLLLELDRMEFSIPGTNDGHDQPITIKANPAFRPLIIITSNDEKPLPPAFLRRCLFHYIAFETIPLNRIVKANYGGLTPGLIDRSVDFFKKWRLKIEKNSVGNKNITTSELLDWIKIINYYVAAGKTIPAFNEDQLPPYSAALLKDMESIKLFISPDVKPKPNE